MPGADLDPDSPPHKLQDGDAGQDDSKTTKKVYRIADQKDANRRRHDQSFTNIDPGPPRGAGQRRLTSARSGREVARQVGKDQRKPFPLSRFTTGMTAIAFAQAMCGPGHGRTGCFERSW